MDREQFSRLLKTIDIYDRDKYDDLLKNIKHNICQNIRIARKLSNLSVEKASELLDLEPQSLRRIEAVNDRDEFSSKVFIMAIIAYNRDANFYFKDYKENELLLNKKVEKQYS